MSVYGIAMLHLWQAYLNPLLRNYSTAIATLIIGYAAYGVYKRQKRDTKRDAANIVLLEIEGAEQQMQKITDASPGNPVQPKIYLMKSASWDKLRYLFIRDLDRNEWDKVTDFYNKCREFDQAVDYQASLFEKNVRELRKNEQKVLAKYAEECIEKMRGKSLDEKVKIEQEYLERRKQFIALYGNNDQDHLYLNYPIQPVNIAKAVLDGIEPSLSLSSVGIKLKRIKNTRNFWQRVKG
jgi:hypothetical protein